MYNNHQGVYTIRGDMCYENKMMSDAALSERDSGESICMPMPEQDRNSAASMLKLRSRLRPLVVANTLLFIILLLFIVLIELGPMPRSRMGFYCQDPAISFPYRGDTITMNILLSGSLLGPLLTIAAIEFYREECANKKWGLAIWCWFRDFMLGMVFNLVITDVAKVIAGEHRPHFIDTCMPDAAISCTAGEYIEDYKCTNTLYSSYLVRDSSRSFPSGHASLSVYVTVFCVMYIQCRLPSRYLGLIIKPFLIIAAISWGLVCALTRISDHRHHWWDVLVGSILGVVVAVYTCTAVCKSFQPPSRTVKARHPSASTTMLLDIKNKDATSVII